MNITKANNLSCPIDGEKLEQSGKQLVCQSGHSFDIAKQGYIHLLPVQDKRSKQPGDSKAMVVARKEFLDSGFYKPVAEKLVSTVTGLLQGDAACILDAGCGEGYYLNTVLNSLRQIDSISSLSLIGVDISKDAVIQSSKRSKEISWIVGTNRKLPVEDASVDIILCLFGFVCVDAFLQVLKPGGKLILVDPGLGHLKELREIIYPQVKNANQSDQSETELPGFVRLSKESLQFKEKIRGNDLIKNLLIMTPHFYRASQQGREVACNLTELDLSVDVIFRVFEKQ